MLGKSRPLVLLFDIDGTLITTGGAGRRALERTFDQLYSAGQVFKDINFGGMTDLMIFRIGFAELKLTASDEEMNRVMAQYLLVLQDEVTRSPRYQMHPGIEAALSRAEQEVDCAFGLGTGNIEPGARIKLSRVGIQDRFAFGGFGSDHADRATLIGIGADRGAARLGRSRADCRVVIIGDTPRDVAAAQAIGAESVAVGTGGFALEALRAAGATYTFNHLEETGALEAIFSRSPR